jgi:hypothetical protein
MKERLVSDSFKMTTVEREKIDEGEIDEEFSE